MTPERWQKIDTLYHAARAQPEAGRAAFLVDACREDAALREEVESLLNEPEPDDGFLARPALVSASRLMDGHDPAVMTGHTLGGYQLRALLGAGGMGEVYQAHDHKLARDVAIEILPRAFTSNPDRLARFEREARMLASLNHPNICGIHGIEESDGIRFLILELVDGDTLAAILTQASTRQAKGGGLPLGEVLAIARQIADALEAAHDKGIIHRDLKPANIKITPEGAVKVLDFGLAKMVSGDASSPSLTHLPAESQGGPRQGAIIGTAAYMSPEQARGLPVDKRTDIWAFGCVLYEMLTGRVAFPGETVSDAIAKILEREPDWSALPATTPVPLRRLLIRCLEKDPKQRQRDIGDARMEIDAIDEATAATTTTSPPPVRPRSGVAWLPWVAFAALVAAVGAWEMVRPAVPGNPLDGATFRQVTNWEGTEELAEISPDGTFVAFLADRTGQFDVWVNQLGTANTYNLTPNLPPLLTPANLLRNLGFSFNGSEIWLSPGSAGGRKVLMPLTGGTPRPFLGPTDSTPSWSSDGSRLAYIAATNPETPGDPLFIADHTGADPHLIPVADQGTEKFFRRQMHNHNPVWSLDNQWIYLARGSEPSNDMDVWRVRPSGDAAEQLTQHHAPVSFLTPLNRRTLLYVARAEDWSGPWLWALDLETKLTRRVTAGLEQHTSVSASRDGRRVVTTVATPRALLWSVPLLNRPIDDRDAQPYPVPAERALAPRFGGTSLFYLSLSSLGTGDGLWRVTDAQAFEVRRGADGVVSEPPIPSPDGSRVAVIVRKQGKRHLAIMSADGTSSRTLAPSIEILGGAGRGTADWSPDGRWIVTGGSDGKDSGVFKIPVDGGGEPVRLVTGEAVNPVWSPAGDLIVYASPYVGGLGVLRAVRPDGNPAEIPAVQVRSGGGHRFLRSGLSLVYLKSTDTKDFWLIDLVTNTSRQLTHLSDRGYLNNFDITPDGKYLVFDRVRQNSDVVLIDLPERK